MTEMTFDMTYLARREAQERAAAQLSSDPTARRVHLEMADLYAQQRERGPIPSA